VAEAESAAQEAAALLKRRLAERKDDTERYVLLLRQLGEPDDSLLVRQADNSPTQPSSLCCWPHLHWTMRGVLLIQRMSLRAPSCW